MSIEPSYVCRNHQRAVGILKDIKQLESCRSCYFDKGCPKYEPTNEKFNYDLNKGEEK